MPRSCMALFAVVLETPVVVDTLCQQDRLMHATVGKHHEVSAVSDHAALDALGHVVYYSQSGVYFSQSGIPWHQWRRGGFRHIDDSQLH